MKLLTTQADRDEAATRLRELLGAHGEWFCTQTRAGREQAPFALRAGEWELRASLGALHLSCWTDAGACAWRVAAWECSGGHLRLRVTRRMGAERATLELVPRASARAGALAVAAARRAACERLAETIRAHAHAQAEGALIERARLSAGARRSEPGRYARVLLLSGKPCAGRRELIAATGPVVEIKPHEIDGALASALDWWARLDVPARAKSARGKLLRQGRPRLWLVFARGLSQAMSERIALLSQDARAAISLFEYDETSSADRDETSSSDDETSSQGYDETSSPDYDETSSPDDGEEATWLVDDEPRGDKLVDEELTSDKSADDESAGDKLASDKLFGNKLAADRLFGNKLGGDGAERRLTPVEIPPLDSLLARVARFVGPVRAGPSETAERLVALAPAEIDVIRARRGETVRFNGLPFARVRQFVRDERVWFGAQSTGRKVLLDEVNWSAIAKLIDELREHRRAGSPDARHAYFRAAPEAWLESILRRDITRLDPGLVVAPLYAQLRTTREGAGARPVDLLALRRDGRLVVIELKVTEDAALPIQGADYWRRVESHRRSGALRRARLFGDLLIADEPPLVYLVAPVFRFQRAFARLARLVDPRIEAFRFDINEDWRAGVRVVRRTRVN